MESGFFAICRIGMAALLATSGCLTAQTPQQSSPPGQSGIHFVVIDQSGAVIQNSKVAVLQTETGIRVEGTDLAGTFQSPPLGPGRYSVTVEQFGFKTAKALVDLSSQEMQALSITLLVAPTDIGSGSNPSYAPGVESITSTLGSEQLPEPPPSQAEAGIDFVVLDPVGAAIPHAKVWVTSGKAKLGKGATGDDGSLSLSLPPGPREFRVKLPGFQTYKGTALVPPHERVKLTVKLQYLPLQM